MQELLEFSLAHQSQLAADGDLFGYDSCDGMDEEEALAAAQAEAAAAGSGQEASVAAISAALAATPISG